jgi:hypothetical protein
VAGVEPAGRAPSEVSRSSPVIMAFLVFFAFFAFFATADAAEPWRSRRPEIRRRCIHVFGNRRHIPDMGRSCAPGCPSAGRTGPPDRPGSASATEEGWCRQRCPSSEPYCGAPEVVGGPGDRRRRGPKKLPMSADERRPGPRSGAIPGCAGPVGSRPCRESPPSPIVPPGKRRAGL